MSFLKNSTTLDSYWQQFLQSSQRSHTYLFLRGHTFSYWGISTNGTIAWIRVSNGSSWWFRAHLDRKVLYVEFSLPACSSLIAPPHCSRFFPKWNDHLPKVYLAWKGHKLISTHLSLAVSCVIYPLAATLRYCWSWIHGRSTTGIISMGLWKWSYLWTDARARSWVKADHPLLIYRIWI